MRRLIKLAVLAIILVMSTGTTTLDHDFVPGGCVHFRGHGASASW